MNKKIAALLIVAVTLVTGCSALQKSHPLLTPVNPTVLVVTNTVTQTVTNETVKAIVVTVTNTVQGQTVIQTVTNTVQVPVITTVQVPVLTVVTNWQYAPSAAATNALNMASELSPFIPQPFGGVLSLIAGLGGAGLGLYAKLMSGKYRQVISAVAAGVETGADSVTKAAIQNAAAGAGVQHLLDPIVQAVTAKMADQQPTATPAKA